MKKFLSYILIFSVVVQIFAPLSFGVDKNMIRASVKKAEAGHLPDPIPTLEEFKTAFKSSNLKVLNTITTADKTSYVDIDITLSTGYPENSDSTWMWKMADCAGSFSCNSFDDKDFILLFKEKGTNKTGYYNITGDLLSGDLINKREDITIPVSVFKHGIFIGNNSHPIVPVNGLSVLSAETQYTVTLYYQALAGDISVTLPSDNKGEDILGDKDPDYFSIVSDSFTTATVAQGFNGETGTGEAGQVSGANPDPMPACSILNGALGTEGTLMGCVAQVFYYVFFVPTSFVFALAGTFFDSALNYSLQSDSYKSPFVVQGWGVVRDFCNMFFIFILLYIAFATILNLGGVKTKEMIVNVVIVGLFINFSLFATQIIIDTSNVLARVFYNSNTIKVTQDGSSGGDVFTKVGPNGEIPLSSAIVNKINPQNLIINGTQKVDDFSDKANIGDSNKPETLGVGKFILITLLATVVNIVGLITFFSVALIFVVRVIGLWIAMIASPFVFFSYTVPAMQNIEMVGWKKWWPQTLSLAFVAPVFVFFMYLIVAFLEKGLSLVSSDAGTSGMTWIISIVLPFVFIMVLLIQAKKIAVKMSGEMGAAVAKAGAAVGGAAVGLGMMAATGGAAALMRRTIGKGADNMTNNEDLKKRAEQGGIKGRFARMQLNAARSVSKGSFDVRNTKLGGKLQSGISSGLGTNINMGKAKEGGYAKYKEDKIKKKEEWAERLKPGENSPEVIRKREVEEAKKMAEATNEKSLNEIDGKIAAKRIDVDDAYKKQQFAKDELARDPENEKKKKAAIEASESYSQLNKDLESYKTVRNNIVTGNGVEEEEVDKNGNKTGKKKMYTTDIDGKKYEIATQEITLTQEMKDSAKQSLNNMDKKIGDQQGEVTKNEKTLNDLKKSEKDDNEKAKSDADKYEANAITKAGQDFAASIKKAEDEYSMVIQNEMEMKKKLDENPTDERAQTQYQMAKTASDNAYKKRQDLYDSKEEHNGVIISKNQLKDIMDEKGKIMNEPAEKIKVAEDTLKASKEKLNEILEKNKTTYERIKNITDSNVGEKVKRTLNEIRFEDMPGAQQAYNNKVNEGLSTLAETYRSMWFGKKINDIAAHNTIMDMRSKS